MQCAGSGEGSARPAGGKTASERSGTHPMHAGRYGAYKLHGVGSRGNPDAATAAHAARIAQAHTLPWAAARGALIAQGAETRQNTLQSAPRQENDIGGRHTIVYERRCRRKCQKGRIASTSRRGAPPPPFTAPPAQPAGDLNSTDGAATADHLMPQSTRQRERIPHRYSRSSVGTSRGAHPSPVATRLRRLIFCPRVEWLPRSSFVFPPRHTELEKRSSQGAYPYPYEYPYVPGLASI